MNTQEGTEEVTNVEVSARMKTTFDHATFVITAPVVVTTERVSDLLCCALEGGSNYWYQIQRYEIAGTTDAERKAIVNGLNHPHLEVPFLKGGALQICDNEADDGFDLWRLDRAAMQRGLELMAQTPEMQRHWVNFVRENEDAETGDAFLQLSLFGETVYG